MKKLCPYAPPSNEQLAVNVKFALTVSKLTVEVRGHKNMEQHGEVVNIQPVFFCTAKIILNLFISSLGRCISINICARVCQKVHFQQMPLGLILN